MESTKLEKPSINRLVSVKRKAVSMSQEGLIKAEFLQPEKPLPLVVQPTVEGVNLAEWVKNNRDFVNTNLLKHGGILFRKFHENGLPDFEQLIKTNFGEMVENIAEQNIHNEFAHAEQNIFLHNEYSDKHTWPLKIFFYCVQPAQQGGETPIANCQQIFQCINPKIRERFLQKKWMLVRNYSGGLGLNWQSAFQTTNKATVEKYCRSHNIEFEWKDNNRLKTRTVLPAITKHPKTGEILWFNQLAFLHVSTLEPAIHQALLAEFKEEYLPNNTYYGDGSPVEPSVLDEIRDCYRQETVSFPWQQGDVLMLDNMLTAHGRAQFIGEQKVFVGMSEPFSSKNI